MSFIKYGKLFILLWKEFLSKMYVNFVKAFLLSFVFIIWFFSYNLLIWWITLIDFQMLNQLYLCDTSLFWKHISEFDILIFILVVVVSLKYNFCFFIGILYLVKHHSQTFNSLDTDFFCSLTIFVMVDLKSFFHVYTVWASSGTVFTDYFPVYGPYFLSLCMSRNLLLKNGHFK